MAIIHNKSKQALSILAKEFTGFAAPGDTVAVPDDVAREWMTQPVGEALVLNGLVSVDAMGKELKAKSSEPPTGVVEATEAPTAGKPVHWRTAIAHANGLTDIDELCDLHAEETRPRVVEAIEARMTEIRGA